MNVFLIVLSYILVVSLAFIFGYVVSNIMRKTKSYSGTIKIIPNEDKLIYSLELNENPVMLQYMNEVIFKVDTSEESSDRE